MLQKKLEDIVLQDILSLIENQVPESKTLEYKSQIKLEKENDKKEFLFDVSSFANAQGGDLLYGVAEGSEKGLPGLITGIDGNMDELCRKIEDMLRECIAPRILNIKMKPIDNGEGKNILIIHIPISFNAPHQVTFQKSYKFYGRSNSGKYMMDINELRNSFLLAGSYCRFWTMLTHLSVLC